MGLRLAAISALARYATDRRTDGQADRRTDGQWLAAEARQGAEGRKQEANRPRSDKNHATLEQAGPALVCLARRLGSALDYANANTAIGRRQACSWHGARSWCLLLDTDLAAGAAGASNSVALAGPRARFAAAAAAAEFRARAYANRRTNAQAGGAPFARRSRRPTRTGLATAARSLTARAVLLLGESSRAGERTRACARARARAARLFSLRSLCWRARIRPV